MLQKRRRPFGDDNSNQAGILTKNTVGVSLARRVRAVTKRHDTSPSGHLGDRLGERITGPRPRSPGRKGAATDLCRGGIRRGPSFLFCTQSQQNVVTRATFPECSLTWSFSLRN